MKTEKMSIRQTLHQKVFYLSKYLVYPDNFQISIVYLPMCLLFQTILQMTLTVIFFDIHKPCQFAILHQI